MERGTLIKGKGQNPSTKRKTGERFQWKANGLALEEDLAVFNMRIPQETERHQRKERRTQEYLASKAAVNNEQRRKGEGEASSSVPTGKGHTDVKSSTSLEASPATGAKIPCLWESKM